ncbi:hypothetical protein CPT03_09010 [Pedobacter ginsengisoli]|uniref:Uncharacterized protein n=2 Tax=Pedobacter ginsengisoli TaxID=363852 RepID=A0A2D1U4S1_9SPHI|nr:hypothetical protein CPT03_09010 [Pedobacter ginsengisoli]
MKNQIKVIYMRTKIKTLLASALIITTILLSCNNIKESIERDLFITPTGGISFTIPKISSTESGAVIGDLNVKNLNLDSLINNASPRFGLKNVKTIRIKEFNLEFLNADSLNNIQNIENIIVKIQASGQTVQSIATANPSSNVVTSKLSIPITAGNSDIRAFLTSTSFSYNLSAKLRTATTKELKARATVTYTISVGL